MKSFQIFVRISLTHSTQRVLLRDNGSTHGTCVGNLNLKPNEDHSLTNDEVISFGVRVTVGER